VIPTWYFSRKKRGFTLIELLAVNVLFQGQPLTTRLDYSVEDKSQGYDIVIS